MTVAQLITDISNAKNTGSGKVEWNSNSLQSIFSNDVAPLIKERGIAQVANTTALQALSGAESWAAGIDGVGIFFWAATGTPNGSTIFSASGGGVWKKQNVVQSMSLSGLSDVLLSSPTNGQVLSYLSGKWVNTNATTSLSNLTDVNSSQLGGYVFYRSDIDSKFRTTPYLKISEVGLSSINVKITGTLETTGVLVVGGGLNLSGSLIVSGTLSVSAATSFNGNFAINTNKFNVTAASGNTAIAGTLGVEGKLTIGYIGTGGLEVVNGNLDVSSGSVYIASALTVDDAIVANNGIDMTGGLSVDGVISTTGDLNINTNKFKVVAASGNTTVAGTLGVASDFAINTNKFNVTATNGNTLIAGTLGVANNFAVATNKFNVNAANGNTSVAGSLLVGGGLTVTAPSSISQIVITDSVITIPSLGNITFGTTTFAAGAITTATSALDTTKYWSVTIAGLSRKIAMIS